MGVSVLLLIVVQMIHTWASGASLRSDTSWPLVYVAPVVGVANVIPVMALAMIFNNGSRVVAFRRDIRWAHVRRMLLRTGVPDDAPELASLTPVWPGVAWHERETHEMFGIEVTGFDDGTGLGLRPLLLPDGFEGTPLRKSFQLAARASKTWPGGKEPGEGHDTAKSPSRRRVQAPGVPPPEWGPR